jgi:hypothetical protein
VIATDIPSHTQVLNERIAELAPPDPEGIAGALERILLDVDRGRALAGRAREYMAEHYGEQKYLETLDRFLHEVVRAAETERPSKGIIMRDTPN